MSRRKFSRVSGLVGSSIIAALLVGLHIYLLNGLISGGETGFAAILALYMTVPLGLIPALSLLILTISNSDRTAGLVTTAIFHILGGLWFGFIGVVYIVNSLNFYRISRFGWDLYTVFNLAVYSALTLGSILLLVSATLKVVTLFKDKPNRPRQGGYLPYYR